MKAVDQLNDVVREADNSNKEGLERAEKVLNSTSKMFPEQAEYGISNALENVERAKNRVPEEMTVSGRRGGGVLPDIQMPDIGGDGEVKSPVSDGGSEEKSAR